MNSDSGRRMITYLPHYYVGSLVMKSIIDEQGRELDQIAINIDDLFDQLFVLTATWGLEIWERALGIAVDIHKTYTDRRSNILAKLRSTGVVTSALVKTVVDAYTNGQVEVVDRDYKYAFDTFREMPGPPPYTFRLHFTDKFGIPSGIEDVKRVIEMIKPAHLVVEYVFMFLYWNVLDEQNLTWDQLDAKTIQWNEFESGTWLNKGE